MSMCWPRRLLESPMTSVFMAVEVKAWSRSLAGKVFSWIATMTAMLSN